MCGICGFTGPRDDGVLERMMDALHHRGPDGRGEHHHGEVHLGHNRLKVIDLETGQQPIYNEDRTVCVVFNGEIYNFRELRRDLEARGHRFSTRTDTEVLVHLYEEHGLDLTRHLDGMYAFALHDMVADRLVLVRDPVGIKPLMYAQVGGELVFASEVKGILPHRAVVPRLDRDAAHLLLNIRFVPSPWTLFEGVRKLPPGHRLVREGGRDRVEPYWDWGDATPLSSKEEATEGFLHHLEASVDRQMVSDVPLGLFLSGGLDSGGLVAAARRRGHDNLETFTLGFDEPTDEIDDARLVAEAFETRHHVHVLDPNPLEEFRRIVHHVEEPKVNATQGFHLAEFARRHVTVALSGLGGDELFCGYDVYRQLDVVRRVGRALGPFRGVAGAVARMGRRLGLKTMGPRFENLRRGLELVSNLSDPAVAYGVLRNAWDLDDEAVLRLYPPEVARGIGVRTREVLAPWLTGTEVDPAAAMDCEFHVKMVEDFLVNEDRVSMAHSLEVRVPYLDLEMVRFARRIPWDLKFSDGELKSLMRRAFTGILPARTLKKPKWGFTFNPYLQFTKDLGTTARATLTREKLDRLALVRPEIVEEILDHPPSRWMRWHYFFLWMILGLVHWIEVFEDGEPP